MALGLDIGINKNNMKYPILIFKKNDNNIYALKSRFEIASVGGDEFYKNLTVINVEGEIRYSKSVKVIGRAQLKYCLLYFQKMIEVKVSYKDEIDFISLDDLKIKIFNHIKKKPKKWLTLDTLEGIKELIDKAKSYEELFLIFR